MPRTVRNVTVSLSPSGHEALRRIQAARFGDVERRTSVTIEQLILEEDRRLGAQQATQAQHAAQHAAAVFWPGASKQSSEGSSV